MKQNLLRNGEGDVKQLRSGEYVQVNTSDTWAKYKCPSCGFLTSLIKTNHYISPLGEVTPAANCPHKTGSGRKCDFSALITLDDWIPVAKGLA